jgi:hypothetical protein
MCKNLLYQVQRYEEERRSNGKTFTLTATRADDDRELDVHAAMKIIYIIIIYELKLII